MLKRILCWVALAAILYAPSTGLAGLSQLGSAQDFAVLGASTVTNTGATTVYGSLGLDPGSAITGFPPGTVTGGSIYGPGGVSNLAQSAALTAYNALALLPYAYDLTGQDLGGLTLASGVYHFDTSAQLTGTLTLDAQGKNNAFWVFQIGSTLTTASSSVVDVINLGSNDGRDDGVFWQVGSSATLGTGTTFEGNIVALTSITLNTGATIPNGRALARNGAVTLDDNVISIVCPNGGPGYSGGLTYDKDGTTVVPAGGLTPVVPLPSALLLGGCGLVSLLAFRRRLVSVA